MRRFEHIGENWRLLLKAGGITALAFLLSGLLVAPFSASTSSIFSSPEKTDFVLSDFYAQVADRRPVRSLSDRIVMVDIDRTDRDGIAEILEMISLCGPDAVGIDINFEEAREDDYRLLSAIKSCPAVVLPLGLSEDGKGSGFNVSEKPFFYGELQGVEYGAANLPGKYERSSIREFPVAFQTAGGSELPSFVAAIARMVSPDSYRRLMERGNEIEIIDYASMEIPVMSVSDIYDNPESLSGKVVMLGAVNEASDMHSTPVAQSMAGLMIHSYALSTVLNGSYYSNMPKYVDYLLASLLCFLIVFLSVKYKAKVKGMLLRFLQVVLVYVVVRVGYSLYVDYRIVANFSNTLLMVAFGLFAIDIWNGAVGVMEIAVGWWHRLPARISLWKRAERKHE